MSESSTGSDVTWLRNGRLISADRAMKRADVEIRGRRIQSIGKSPTRRTPGGANIIDVDGLTVFPGFIDIHIHGAAGVDTMEADVVDLTRLAGHLATQGVTSWLPTLVPAPDEDYRQATAAIERLMRGQADEPSPAAARALGVHYEGPFVNAAQCGALRTPYFRVFDSPAELDRLARINHDNAVHMITLAPEIEGGVELVRELARRGWIVSIGHTRAPVEILDEALAAGARHMTHFFNAMTGLHHRQPGAVGWGLARDEVTCDIIADGVHVEPLALKVALRCKTAERLILISDAVAPAGMGDGEFQMWGEKMTVQDQRTSNERGSIAGSVISLCDAVRMMLGLGATAHEVAQMTALNPARLLGVEADCGSIEVGKRADMVALDDEGNVRLTLVGGRIAFDAR